MARVRVCPAHRDYNLTASRPEEWLLIEWPREEAEPAEYWLSTLPQNIDFSPLVDTAKLRWRIERGKRTFIVSGKRSLTRSQAGNWHRTLRRPRMARLPPPRHALHRGLRLSDLRAGDASPLSRRLRQEDRKSCPSRGLQAKGICRSGRKGTFQTQSQRSSEGSPPPWREACRDVHAAARTTE